MKQTGKAEFDFLVGKDFPGAHPMLHEEKEWWLEEGRLGVVILDKVDHDWSWIAVATHPKRKKWAAYDSGINHTSIDSAREALHKALTAGPKGEW